MSYLDQERFEDKPKSLVFNGGKAGVVHGCKVEVAKKTSEDDERSPDYKLFAYDTEQTVNTNPDIPVYPVNKGFYRKGLWDKTLTKEENKAKGNFGTEGAETFAVNELNHLLKTFDHPMGEKGKLAYSRSVVDYNDFLDYTFEYINNTLKAKKDILVDVVVDYGDSYAAKSYLRLAGYPWYIGKQGDTLANKRDAIMERVQPESEGSNDSPFSSDTGTTEDSGSANWID